MQAIQNSTNNCPLCNGKSTIFYKQDKKHFFQCLDCHGIFLNQKLRLNSSDEIVRYELHENDVEDKNYQQFVSPITNAVLENFTKKDKGLDFGAGTGPVISKVLKDFNYQIAPYDPFFHKNPSLLEATYNYIACCEVMEHFYHPKKEFNLLKKLLKTKGKLYCMTALYDDTIDFEHWYYKNDPTHVFIYHQKTIHWIKESIGFSEVIIDGRLITFTN